MSNDVLNVKKGDDMEQHKTEDKKKKAKKDFLRF